MRGSAAAVMLTRQEGGGKSPAHRHVFCAYTPPSFDPSPRTRTSCQEEGKGGEREDTIRLHKVWPLSLSVARVKVAPDSSTVLKPCWAGRRRVTLGPFRTSFCSRKARFTTRNPQRSRPSCSEYTYLCVRGSIALPLFTCCRHRPFHIHLFIGWVGELRLIRRPAIVKGASQLARLGGLHALRVLNKRGAGAL